jgi:hypothetical protein
MSKIFIPPPEVKNAEVRLLVCANCKTIEVLDDYTGPQERADEYDVVLNVALEKHKDGVERRPHVGQMFRVQEADWLTPVNQEQIREQVIAKFDPNAETGLGAAAYAMRDTFREDAMTCWTRDHNRNPGCPDYMSDTKRLVPGTDAERKEAGIPKFDKHNPATQRFLCEYCPVHSLVQQSKRKKAGMYDN